MCSIRSYQCTPQLFFLFWRTTDQSHEKTNFSTLVLLWRVVVSSSSIIEETHIQYTETIISTYQGMCIFIKKTTQQHNCINTFLKTTNDFQTVLKHNGSIIRVDNIFYVLHGCKLELDLQQQIHFQQCQHLDRFFKWSLLNYTKMHTYATFLSKFSCENFLTKYMHINNYIFCTKLWKSVLRNSHNGGHRCTHLVYVCLTQNVQTIIIYTSH